MKERIRPALVLLLLLALLLPPASVSTAATAEEAEAAQALCDLGLFRGTGSGSGAPVFDLDRIPTRAEAVTLLIRLLGREEEALTGHWSVPFTDVADWAFPYVGCAYAYGLTTGTSATTYGGEAETGEAQYLTFLLRALGYDDAAGDFAWDSPWALSDAIGLTDGSRDADTAFTRGGAALLSRAALGTPCKGSGLTLYETLFPGKKGGSEEAAGAAAYSGEEGDDGGTSASCFQVHFLDVGQADCILVQCDGHNMLIDGGNAADSSLVYSYLQTHAVSYLDYIVCTHPHEDHVGGLAGALNYAAAGQALSPVTDWDTAVFRNFLKYLDRRNVPLTVPRAGDSFALGSAEVRVLGPVRYDAEDVNNLSIVLRVTYGDTAFLFTGDAEREEEQDILAAGYPLQCTVLKVGHHGSDSSTSYPFLYYAAPEYAVISCGADNPYGHPSEAVLGRLRDAGAAVWRTDELGHILCVSDGAHVAFSTEKAAGGTTLPPSEETPLTPAPPEDVPTGYYILNTATLKFHLPACTSAARIKPENRQEFTGSREELIDLGYTPCGICKP